MQPRREVMILGMIAVLGLWVATAPAVLGGESAAMASNSDVQRATKGLDTSPCADDGQTLCLNGDRFAVQVDFATSQGTSGFGNAFELTDDTGYFWFFDPDNVEMVVKVLDACSFSGHFWVFAGGLTNVQVDFTVRDTETGAVQTYSNPQDTPFQPIQDTEAFATCP